MKFGVVIFPGSNCDQDIIHVCREVMQCETRILWHKDTTLQDLTTEDCIMIPGGFSYGDYLRCGAIARFSPVMEKVIEHANNGGYVFGICNGFQVLVRAGILPGSLSGDSLWHPGVPQTVSLTYNDSGKFEDRWVRLKVSGRSVWTQGLPDTVLFPVAHAEGKFVAQDEEVLHSLQNNRQVIFRYCSEDGRPASYPENPNGSVEHIAGIADRTGRVLGLMPHPERHLVLTQHPAWTRRGEKSEYGDGAGIFQNGVAYAEKNLV